MPLLLKVSEAVYFVLNSFFTFVVLNCRGGGTPRKLATATQPQFPRTVISLSWTHVTKWCSVNWGNCVTVSTICAAPYGKMCSAQAYNSSMKLRLRCGCQFSWCALGLGVVTSVLNTSWKNWVPLITNWNAEYATISSIKPRHSSSS
jgi:hypothetical protein